jgi:hypothetical protein
MWNVGTEDGDYYDTSEGTGYAVHSGSRAWRQWDNEGWAIYQDVSGVVPGTWYDVSVWVYSGNTSSGDQFGNDGGTDRDAGVRVVWDDDGTFWEGDYVDMGIVDPFDPDDDPHGQWVQLSASVQAPADMYHIRFELHFDETVSSFDGSISFDDAYLGEAVPEPSTFVMMGLALAGAGLFRTKLKKERLRKGTIGPRPLTPPGPSRSRSCAS